ncbi:hypothetical protein A2630_03970 [Candidatus Woesebacteria bacterium RIFCSPHIGHO2_01_FULL_44_10]|uniref:Pyridoxamine 5'-phosphate oxidase N-terminal domain-containing protein n=1 Tax=Candidatus Woesebacteria bacterium RIFCSPLOWO2_01_FULL_44_14 TaxID=1802525 RepID=A0A1F8C1T1_9BACT|nr:MAG: hypothetical protein A2630_03970 [Candidatus Woesebacteria bacterium RIFCSPHIGHO2_01_FULL_44_10]OGM55969.1 MAG: hypothetical protein A3F62_05340 [Candidatus Woesebacteria bacterium RIFCSPHIGHO2_12_FULL_44_11]OGM69779.1 MAG: hypothetical protein A2975_00275 [Candidatus Woesebacteria bacterium RIFCSPLOWO2_01_FULL_44_14]
MDQKVLEFLRKERVCSLTTLLKDGTPHSAAMHFSHLGSPLAFYFSADKAGSKCEDLLDGIPKKAAVVVGFSEEEWITLQMEGKIQVVSDPQAVAEIKKIHYVKNPSSKEFESDPGTIFLEFTPTWWRYTDFNINPPTIVSSKNG